MGIIEKEKIDSFLILRLNDIKRKNIISKELLLELDEQLSFIENENTIHGVIITGNDKIFSAGADIKTISNQKEQKNFLLLGRTVFDKIINLKKITVAAVNGIAFGGGLELALSCDIICASKNAFFSFPEVKLGLFPGWGATQLLPLRVGLGITKELILTGKTIDSEEAYEITLIDRLFETDKSLINGCLSLMNDMFVNSPNAIFKAKKIINMRINETVSEGIKKENTELSKWLDQAHAKEGINAFIEKRKPKWN